MEGQGHLALRKKSRPSCPLAWVVQAWCSEGHAVCWAPRWASLGQPGPAIQGEDGPPLRPRFGRTVPSYRCVSSSDVPQGPREAAQGERPEEGARVARCQLRGLASWTPPRVAGVQGRPRGRCHLPGGPRLTAPLHGTPRIRKKTRGTPVTGTATGRNRQPQGGKPRATDRRPHRRGSDSPDSIVDFLEALHPLLCASQLV